MRKWELAELEQPSFEWRNIWASPNLTINIQIRIFNTTAKHVLLYGAKKWRTMAATLKKIQTFIKYCLIFRISNTEFWKRTTQQQKMRSSKDLEMDWTHPPKPNDLYHTYIPDLKPTGKEKARPSENTCCHNLEAERKRLGYTWGQCERLAQDQDAWRALVGGLCSITGQRQWWW